MKEDDIRKELIRIAVSEIGKKNVASASVRQDVDFDGTELALELLAPFLAVTAVDFLNHAKVDPDFEPLRNDPRFKAMIAAAEKRLGQPPSATA